MKEIPDQCSSIAYEKPFSAHSLSGLVVQNTTATKGLFQRLATQFGAMYKRKAFLHWYVYVRVCEWCMCEGFFFLSV